MKDRRTAGQRRHDALLDALTRLCLAETSHGALVPAREALRWGGADRRILTVRTTSDDGADTGAVTGHSDTRRLFSENQRLAILARDRGRTFPACDRPAAWSQIHHILPWGAGGPTTIDNAALIRGHHHRTFAKSGWQCIALHGRPAWIPPPHIDPERRPRRNRLHDLPSRT